MRKRQLLELISEGESSTVEFKRKSASPEKIAREIIAFANSRGGHLLIGVDDDGSIVGVGSEKEELADVELACYIHSDPPIEPEIQILHVKRKDVIVVSVSESDCKPHRLVSLPTNGKDHEEKVYIRYGDKTLLASKEMRSVLRSQHKDAAPVTLSIGQHERRVFDHLEGNDRITVKEFADLSNISEGRAARLLVRLVKAGVLTICATETADFFILTD